MMRWVLLFATSSLLACGTDLPHLGSLEVEPSISEQQVKLDFSGFAEVPDGRLSEARIRLSATNGRITLMRSVALSHQDVDHAQRVSFETVANWSEFDLTADATALQVFIRLHTIEPDLDSNEVQKDVPVP